MHWHKSDFGVLTFHRDFAILFGTKLFFIVVQDSKPMKSVKRYFNNRRHKLHPPPSLCKQCPPQIPYASIALHKYGHVVKRHVR